MKGADGPRHASAATLAMYDLPELRAHTDAWWAALARALRAEGLDAPERLDRGRPAEAVLHDPELLLGQTCGLPLMTTLRDIVQVIAVPTYRAEGCAPGTDRAPGTYHTPGTYRSRVVVRAALPVTALHELRGRRVAINQADSHSGTSGLLAAIAPHAAPGRFFGEVEITGSHRASLDALRAGRADVAAIDAVTWALLHDVAPATLHGLRTLTFTDPAPCLPYVTARRRTPSEVERLQRALRQAIADPTASHARHALRLIDLHPSGPAPFSAILAHRARGAKIAL